MQAKFLVRSFLVLAILALGTVACGGTTPTAEEEETVTETSGSESSDDTVATTTDDTMDTTTTPTDSNTATETPTDDTDDDDDGAADTADNCPLTANPDQTDTDADGTGDACDEAAPLPIDDTDDDDDGVADTADNCPLTANPDQTDTDTDGAGDACDEDANTPTVTAATNTGAALNTATSTLVATANTTFALTFSAPLSAATSIADQVTVNCASGNQTFIPSAASTDADDAIINNEFVITPDGLPSGEACTLTVLATPVGDGTTSTMETAFLLNTCGLTDDFSDATSLDVCWTAGENNAAKLTDSIDPVASTVTFSIAAGTTTAAEDSLSYSKVVDGTNVFLTGNFNSVEGLTAAFDPADPSSLPDGVLLQAIAVDPADPSNSTSISCGIISNGGTGLTAILHDGVGTANAALSTEGTSVGSITIVLKKAGVDFSCEFLQDGADTIGLSGIALAFDDPQSIQAGIFFMHSGSAELKTVVDDLSFSVEVAPAE